MSRGITVSFEVRDMRIMKDTIKEMGLKFDEVTQEQIQIQRFRRPIVISSAGEGSISFDEEDRKTVCDIRKNYGVNYYRDRAIREGMDVEVKKQANGEVKIELFHG